MHKQRDKHPANDRAPRSTGMQQVRIIGGQWKRTPLPVLHTAGLRPTPDRVRETVFNWLHHLLDGSWQQLTCLDLFAGTGALGFEAASRGAAKVVLVESYGPAIKQLETIKEKLNAHQVSITRADAWQVAQQWAQPSQTSAGLQNRFDLIFLDPPYQQGWLPKILPLCATLLGPDGLIYAEAEEQLDPEQADWLSNWEIVRADKAGMVFFHLLRNRNAAEIQA